MQTATYKLKAASTRWNGFFADTKEKDPTWHKIFFENANDAKESYSVVSEQAMILNKFNLMVQKAGK